MGITKDQMIRIVRRRVLAALLIPLPLSMFLMYVVMKNPREIWTFDLFWFSALLPGISAAIVYAISFVRFGRELQIVEGAEGEAKLSMQTNKHPEKKSSIEILAIIVLLGGVLFFVGWLIKLWSLANTDMLVVRPPQVFGVNLELVDPGFILSGKLYPGIYHEAYRITSGKYAVELYYAFIAFYLGSTSYAVSLYSFIKQHNWRKLFLLISSVVTASLVIVAALFIHVPVSAGLVVVGSERAAVAYSFADFWGPAIYAILVAILAVGYVGADR